MTVDWSINVGMLVTIAFMLAGFAGGAFGLYYGIRGNLNQHKYMLETFGGRMINIETELRTMRDVLTQVAVQDERMSSLDARMQSQTQRLDNLTERVNQRLNHADG